jgi:adenylosuccinate synthase
MIDVLLGLQWGDEGKGKIVDYLAPNYNIVARFQGGPNAGHTLYLNNKKIVLHQIPSGILHENILNLIGSGVVLDPITLQSEIESLNHVGVDASSNLVVSNRASLIIPTHRALDKASEINKGNQSIGSTLKGIGPAYMDNTGRNSIRIGDIFSSDFDNKYKALKDKHQKILDCYNYQNDDFLTEEHLFFSAIDRLRKLNIVSGEYWLNNELNNSKSILAEGAQGSMLDVTFGTFPFVTSSHTLSGGVCTGLGVSPKNIRHIYGITKAYCTRVGNGPFPTELNDEIGEKLRVVGNEFGATTGRPRGCGWIDLVALKYACMISGVTHLIMTKIDIMDVFETIKVCHEYQQNGKITNNFPFEYTDDITPVYKELKGWNCDTQEFKDLSDFTSELKNYLKYVSTEVGVQISHVSNGSSREKIVSL